MSANATLPPPPAPPFPFPHCFADAKSRVRLDGTALDVAYGVFAVACLVSIIAYIVIKVYNDDEGQLRSVARTVPVVALAVAYALALWVPQACVSPLAFGHWFVAGVGWTAVVYSVCRWAQFKAHRINIIVVLDAYVSASFAAATFAREAAAPLLAVAVAVCVMLYAMANNKDTLGKSIFGRNDEYEYDYDDDDERVAQRRLARLMILKFTIALVLLLGLKYIGGTATVCWIGAMEVLAIMVGMRETRLDRGAHAF